MHKDWLKNKLMKVIEEDDIVELPTGNEKSKNEVSITTVNETDSKSLNVRVIQEMKKLESWLNHQATRSSENYHCGRESR
jgi:hypothetical protein